MLEIFKEVDELVLLARKIERDAIIEAIRAKMEVNRARKWDKLKDGRFKHK